MQLSVIIVSYNVASYLDQALTTLRESLHGVDAEVFVVDNASSDGSVSMVHDRHPGVELITNTDNVGFARANNQAIARARGDYVLLLNPDTVLRQDTIGTMLSFFRNTPQAGVAGCKVLNPDGSLQLACRRGFPTPSAAFFKLVGLSDLFPGSRMFGAYNMTYLDPGKVSEVDAVSGSFMMMRKQALDEAGVLDEDFFMYGEDLDLCFRIKEAGWSIYYVPDTEIIHFKGESTRTVPTAKSLRDFYTAMHIFVEKHNRGTSWLFPHWLVIVGIYLNMGLGLVVNGVKTLWQPTLDLLLLNFSLILSISLRFGSNLERAPAYTGLQWGSIFVVYSVLYMTTFYGLGMYHRYRGSTERAIMAIFAGFMGNVFIVNFIKQYNFSRIASFYCWGFNTLFISGWRFVAELVNDRRQHRQGHTALIVGGLDDAVMLRDCLDAYGPRQYEIAGCIAADPGTIRGTDRDGLHVLGLLDDLPEVMRDYGIDTVIMVGAGIPFSRILTNSPRFGFKRPEFKFVPELKSSQAGDTHTQCAVPMIDIHA